MFNLLQHLFVFTNLFLTILAFIICVRLMMFPTLSEAKNFLIEIVRFIENI